MLNLSLSLGEVDIIFFMVVQVDLIREEILEGLQLIHPFGNTVKTHLNFRCVCPFYNDKWLGQLLVKYDVDY